MTITMWIVGGVIFSAYMYFTIWNINNGSKKQKENKSHNRIDVDLFYLKKEILNQMEDE